MSVQGVVHERKEYAMSVQGVVHERSEYAMSAHGVAQRIPFECTG